MYIRIERGASAPISRQIAEQIRAQCLSGALHAGACLPSVRQLARELAVNVNTIVRVYERLAAEGLIELRHGEGTFVSRSSAANDVAAELKEQRTHYTCEFESVVRRGLLLGFTTPELRSLLLAAVSTAKAQISQDTRSENRDGRTSHSR